ncbi:MAG TPA: DUF4440 domain-containing protein [Hyphomicrobiales bacterium]|nr:DUF4440 domain-containing protein [Hyphomicrobiales bacterium]
MNDSAAQMLALELLLLHGDHHADPTGLQVHLAEDFEEISASGHRSDRAAVLQWLLRKDSAWRWALSELRVRELSPTLRLVQYHARQVLPPRPDSRGAWHSSLWRRNAEGPWQLCFHQATRLPTA